LDTAQKIQKFLSSTPSADVRATIGPPRAALACFWYIGSPKAYDARRKALRVAEKGCAQATLIRRQADVPSMDLGVPGAVAWERKDER
jgi:hypothetical protein